MAKFKRRTKGRTTQWPHLNEGQRDDKTMAKFKRRTKGQKFKRRRTNGTNTMAKFKRRRTKGRTTQWPNLNEGQRDGHKGTDNTMAKFKRQNLRRTKGRTKQWPNLNEGQRDRQHNGQI